MKKEIKTYLKRGVICLTIIWVIRLLLPVTYPPRTLTSFDYFLMCLVPLSAFFVAQSNVPWRAYLYYGFFAAFPYFVSFMELRRHNQYVHAMSGHPHGLDYFIPCVILLIVLVLLALGAGVLKQTIFGWHNTRHANHHAPEDTAHKLADPQY